MTLTLTHYDRTITVRTDSDAVDASEAIEVLASLLLAAGYHQDNLVDAMLAWTDEHGTQPSA